MILHYDIKVHFFLNTGCFYFTESLKKETGEHSQHAHVFSEIIWKVILKGAFLISIAWSENTDQILP